MSLNETQILALAPDSSSAKSGKDLAASVAKWKNMGSNDLAIWGECQGSGKDAYKTQIDVQNTAFKCSCPSRKFPCKHGIGLYLLFVRQQSLFSEQQTPDWVSEWIKKRNEKASNTATKESEPVSAEKSEKQSKDKEKRAAQRTSKVANGMAEVDLLLRDWVRAGLLSLQSKSPSYWQEKAAHLVDAQANGVANILLALRDINYAASDWQSQCLYHINRLHLLSNAYRNIDHLPPLLQQDVRQIIGWTLKKEEILSDDNTLQVTDTWLVAAKVMEEIPEQKLTVQYLWLYGQDSQKYALLLDFATPYSPITNLFVPQTAQKMTLAFYPSVTPLRALVNGNAESEVFAKPTHFYENFTDMGDYFSQQLQQNPFFDNAPFWLSQVCLVPHQDKWFLFDQNGLYIPIHSKFSAAYQLLAISGAAPCNLFALYYQQQLIPLGIWSDEQYLIL
jgi:hypothetical protein